MQSNCWREKIGERDRRRRLKGEIGENEWKRLAEDVATKSDCDVLRVHQYQPEKNHIQCHHQNTHQQPVRFELGVHRINRGHVVPDPSGPGRCSYFGHCLRFSHCSSPGVPGESTERRGSSNAVDALRNRRGAGGSDGERPVGRWKWPNRGQVVAIGRWLKAASSSSVSAVTQTDWLSPASTTTKRLARSSLWMLQNKSLFTRNSLAEKVYSWKFGGLLNWGTVSSSRSVASRFRRWNCCHASLTCLLSHFFGVYQWQCLRIGFSKESLWKRTKRCSADSHFEPLGNEQLTKRLTNFNRDLNAHQVNERREASLGKSGIGKSLKVSNLGIPRLHCNEPGLRSIVTRDAHRSWI